MDLSCLSQTDSVRPLQVSAGWSGLVAVKNYELARR